MTTVSYAHEYCDLYGTHRDILLGEAIEKNATLVTVVANDKLYTVGRGFITYIRWMGFPPERKQQYDDYEFSLNPDDSSEVTDKKQRELAQFSKYLNSKKVDGFIRDFARYVIAKLRTEKK